MCEVSSISLNKNKAKNSSAQTKQHVHPKLLLNIKYCKSNRTEKWNLDSISFTVMINKFCQIAAKILSIHEIEKLLRTKLIKK